MKSEFHCIALCYENAQHSNWGANMINRHASTHLWYSGSQREVSSLPLYIYTFQFQQFQCLYRVCRKSLLMHISVHTFTSSCTIVITANKWGTNFTPHGCTIKWSVLSFSYCCPHKNQISRYWSHIWRAITAVNVSEMSKKFTSKHLTRATNTTNHVYRLAVPIDHT